MREGCEKRPFSHCRYCIPIHQAALLSRAEPGVSRPFLLYSLLFTLVIHKFLPTPIVDNRCPHRFLIRIYQN